ncbi:MAG: dTDP-4-dehydrorhamnose 3,5-epimerase family protein [Betaproteobacteria bacterium]|uniref:dTDP-4-dehydrorhamnose 3,5-epimerase n=1 Tax=Candidatus Proximibacter danicus TaxID=2954365 RepID=A0A9D7K4V1_9PROT|nr:dTDP-4-dehydrorhamnose 3,5-epimerase family protein [Candidatus Proximibacter danicus]
MQRNSNSCFCPRCGARLCTFGERNEIGTKYREFYYPEDEAGLLWNDPDLGIDSLIETPIIKARDAMFPRLRDIHSSRLPRD